MRLLALDVATRTGYATGEAGTMPTVGVVILRGPKDTLAVGSNNVGAMLLDMFLVDKPDIVAYEAPLDPVAKFDMAQTLGRPQNSASIIFPILCQGVIEFVCWKKSVRCVSVNRQSVIKHFTGKARHGGREEAKRAVLSRAKLLGYVPLDCKDDDIADACAIFDYASEHFCRKPLQPSELYMWNERA